MTQYRSVGILSLVVVLACSHSRYVLPEPDGGTENASPPTLTGKIVSRTHAELTVLPERKQNAQTVRVSIDTQTLSYTEFGGRFALEQLTVGTRVHVWRAPDSTPRSDGSFAASRIIVETSPEHAPPN